MPTALEHRYQVRGMDCPSCAAKVETAVGRFKEVSDVTVNFATQVLTFRTPVDGASPDAIGDAVRKLGYGVEPIAPRPISRAEEKFRVDGMDCPSCAAKIETAVRQLPGTSDIAVNFATQILSVRLDAATTPPETVSQAVTKLGYRTQHIESLDSREQAGSREGATPAAGEDQQAWWSTPKARLMGLLLASAAFGLVAWLTGLASEQLAFLPTALIGLAYFGRRAIAGARAGTPFSIEMLVSLATAGAVVIGASSEAALVNVLFLLGELLEGLAARRARDGIRALGKLIPRTALLIDGDATRAVEIDTLSIGQVVLVRPGDRMPVDGTIISGSSDVDEAAVTGESIPVPKSPGSSVVAGSVNTTGALKIQVTRRVEDNTINRIIHMVEEAQATKAPTARLIDRFSRYYTPIAILTAALTMLLPPIAFGADWSTWVYRGLGLLLVACPCALVLSTPAAIASALAAGARLGLLIKGGAALEAIGSARTVAFDKTGTLTMGKPIVTDILPIDGTADALLGLAAAVEQGSSHPIARAITDRAAAQNVSVPSSTEQRAVPGKSVEGVVAGARIEILSPRHAAGLGYVPDTHPTITVLEESGKTVVIVAKDKAPIGFIAVRDEPRPDAAGAVARVRLLGITPIMLSGDNQRTAAAVGKALGLEARAELLPDDKLKEIARLKSQGTVVMVGDGINDAPALAAADVGIAMGGGTDVALETADAALLHERVAGVADMIELSQRTRRNIMQNVVIALGLKPSCRRGGIVGNGTVGFWLSGIGTSGHGLGAPFAAGVQRPGPRQRKETSSYPGASDAHFASAPNFQTSRRRTQH